MRQAAALEKIRGELEALRYSQAGKYERAAIRRDRERERERRRRA
jgi:hypothetical protein